VAGWLASPGHCEKHLGEPLADSLSFFHLTQTQRVRTPGAAQSLHGAKLCPREVRLRELAFVRSASINIASADLRPSDPLLRARNREVRADHFVPIIRVPVKSEKLKFAREKSESVCRLIAPSRFTMFVRIRPIDWFFMSGAAFI